MQVVIPTIGSYGGVVVFWGFLSSQNNTFSRFAYFYDDRENNKVENVLVDKSHVPPELGILVDREEDVEVRESIEFWQNHAVFSSVESGHKIHLLAPKLSYKLEGLLAAGNWSALGDEMALITSQRDQQEIVLSPEEIKMISLNSGYVVDRSVDDVYSKLQEFAEGLLYVARKPHIKVLIEVDTTSIYPKITTEIKVLFETSYVARISRGYGRVWATLWKQRRALLSSPNFAEIAHKDSVELAKMEIGKSPQKVRLDKRLEGIKEALYHCRGNRPKHALAYRRRYLEYRNSGLPRGVAKRRALEDRQKANKRSFAWKVYRAEQEQIAGFRDRISNLGRLASVRSPERRRQLKELAATVRAWVKEYPGLVIEVKE